MKVISYLLWQGLYTLDHDYSEVLKDTHPISSKLPNVINISFRHYAKHRTYKLYNIFGKKKRKAILKNNIFPIHQIHSNKMSNTCKHKQQQQLLLLLLLLLLVTVMRCWSMYFYNSRNLNRHEYWVCVWSGDYDKLWHVEFSAKN